MAAAPKVSLVQAIIFRSRVYNAVVISRYYLDFAPQRFARPEPDFQRISRILQLLIIL